METFDKLKMRSKGLGQQPFRMKNSTPGRKKAIVKQSDHLKEGISRTKRK